ncbi:uncharacterized protein Z520_10419 [Fonsecaea multimorphosa CBS 102226]|uniref:Uncharacterized protein n=1 Tax=Fonsecaea multimorphosa CBS 102226 TaxID=1442371 RepID=A0A0D2JTG4_9EURO|nr:uncharacterized protein Z520_10419 [Fonsecaea multimorphosa CBS 102226]KIX93794.1 hypothetical protein Z520_10419 [Fonsecaea multimorphosa CBS 102226]
MPLGLDDDELEASIGMYKLQLKQGPKATHSLQAQASAKDSRLRSATGPSTQRGLLHVRGEDQVEKQLQRLSAVEEETFNSHFRPPVTNSTASPWSKGNVRDPREGKTSTTGCSDEMQPRKLTCSTSLPPLASRRLYCSGPALQYQRTPVRNPCRRRFSYADEFEKELRDMDVKHGCRPKATSTSKSSHTRTQSDLSSTSSSPPQIQKRVSFFWKLKKNVHSHGSTSSAANTEADFDAKEPATNTDVSPRHAGKRSTRFERLVKQLQGCGSDSVGSAPGGGAGQHHPGHGDRERESSG